MAYNLGLFKMKKRDNLHDHIDAFTDCLVDLENLGEVMLEDRKVVDLLLCLRPSSFQSLS